MEVKVEVGVVFLEGGDGGGWVYELGVVGAPG